MAGSSLQLKRSKKGAPKAVEGKVGAEDDACVELKFPFLGSKAFHPFCCRRSWTEDMALLCSIHVDFLSLMLLLKLFVSCNAYNTFPNKTVGFILEALWNALQRMESSQGPCSQCGKE
ncbi:hypothetical protein AV530_012598 [Patagioenas fasciata monilis]|uniref:Uncharacterized protein n=1 Tax=Patagioenas fasciata monilis TaxID=372326 RepID=A0A1V4JB59_PATFA|nr:hypothetical protein AV530_012598 [Patagioenas fasciata monilis]